MEFVLHPLFLYLTPTLKLKEMAEVLYTLTKALDVHYIENLEAVPINYVLEDIDPCTADEIVSTGEQIAVGATLTVPLSKDGLFKMSLTAGASESTIYYNYYLVLQKSMIEDIFTVLCPCDCGCANCTDLSTDKAKALLTARNKIDVFGYLTFPIYTPFINAVHQNTACLVEPQLYCDVTEEGVTGMASYNEQLTKQLIALDYLAMYFADLKGVVDQDEIDNTNSKYQSDAILCCINKLGINIKEIEQIIEDMATITMNSGAYENLPPTDVGDNTLVTANRTPYVFTVADFTSGTTPPYADPEGDAAATVRINTLPADGTLSFNSTAVAPGQIIDVADITSGLLVFIPPAQDAVDSDTFTFSIADTGSGQYTPA